MVLYKEKGQRLGIESLYKFVGDDYEWRRLIIGNTRYNKNVFLFDSTAPRKLFPPEVKVVTSTQTAKRLQFIQINNSLIFIDLRNFKKWKGITINPVRCTVIHRITLERLLTFIKEGRLETSSRRNMEAIKVYK